MNGYEIHIIDDDPVTYEILNEYLESAGFRVSAAFDGRAGLEMMHNSLPDLVLLDIQMPEMDGFQLLEAMRGQRSLQDVPVLFITSLDRTNLKIKGLELGADDFIIKPFERAELFARIKAALRRSDRYRKTENILAGNLVDVSLTELLQTLDIGRKTARITFPEMDGEVFVDRGLLTSVRQGKFSGDAALTRLLFLDKGSFIVDFGISTEQQDDKNIGIQHQVLNGLVCVDEIKKVLAELPEVPPLIEEIPPGFLADDNRLIEKLLPLPLDEFLVMLTGDLKSNATYFVQMCQKRNTKFL